MVYDYDPIARMFFNRTTRKFHSVSKIFVARSLTRGIGLGLICYALGGMISEAYDLYTYIILFLGGPVCALALIKNVLEVNKYKTQAFSSASLGSVLIPYAVRRRNSIKCSRCGESMILIGGMGKNEILMMAKWAFRCLSCKRVYCYNCSDSTIPCKCGQRAWTEIPYFDGI